MVSSACRKHTSGSSVGPTEAGVRGGGDGIGEDLWEVRALEKLPEIWVGTAFKRENTPRTGPYLVGREERRD